MKTLVICCLLKNIVLEFEIILKIVATVTGRLYKRNEQQYSGRQFTERDSDPDRRAKERQGQIHQMQTAVQMYRLPKGMEYIVHGSENQNDSNFKLWVKSQTT